MEFSHQEMQMNSLLDITSRDLNSDTQTQLFRKVFDPELQLRVIILGKSKKKIGGNIVHVHVYGCILHIRLVGIVSFSVITLGPSVLVTPLGAQCKYRLLVRTTQFSVRNSGHHVVCLYRAVVRPLTALVRVRQRLAS